VFIFGQLPEEFSHRLALQRESVRVVHQPVQDGVRQGVVADAGIPLVSRQLADDQRRGLAVAVVHDLHQVVAVGRLQRLQSPVVDQ